MIAGINGIKKKAITKQAKLYFATSFAVGFGVGWVYKRKKARGLVDVQVRSDATFPYFIEEVDILHWLSYYYKTNDIELLPYAFYQLEMKNLLSSPDEKAQWAGFLSHLFEKNPSIVDETAKELLEILSKDCREIVYIALYSLNPYKYRKYVQEFIEKDEDLKEHTHEYSVAGRNLKSLDGLTFENVISKGKAIEGAFISTGDHDILFQLILKASRLWSNESLENEGDLASFYCGLLLRNQVEKICSKHSQARDLLFELAQSSHDELVREFCLNSTIYQIAREGSENVDIKL